mgnify:CR=1 FL=1
MLRVPLLSMQQSVLLCISTILDSGNRALCLRRVWWCVLYPHHRCADYSKMMEMQDDYGHPIFESIKITLVRTMRAHPNPNRAHTAPLLSQVCDDCLKTDHPEKYASS